MQKKSSSGDQLDTGVRRTTSALPISERSASVYLCLIVQMTSYASVVDSRGASPAAPSRIMIVPTKTPREGEGGDSKDELKVQGSTIGGSSLRVRFVPPGCIGSYSKQPRGDQEQVSLSED